MCDYSVMFLLSRDNLDRDFVDVFLMFLGVEKVNWLSDMFFFGLLQDFEGNDYEWVIGFELFGNVDFFSKCY